MNYDDWKLATPNYSEMVSDCCGADYVWSIDKECDIETEEEYVCNKCQDYCEIIEDYEYEAIQRENYEEERAEAKRKYNE
jgi:hypothetical protein